MTTRPSRPTRKKRRKEPLRPVLAARSALSLWDAAIAALEDPADRAELQALKGKHPYPRVYGDPTNPEQARHDELLDRGVEALRAQLSSGSWALSGYHPGARTDDPKESMHPDRAQHATFDCDDSSVTV